MANIIVPNGTSAATGNLGNMGNMKDIFDEMKSSMNEIQEAINNGAVLPEGLAETFNTCNAKIQELEEVAKNNRSISIDKNDYKSANCIDLSTTISDTVKKKNKDWINNEFIKDEFNEYTKHRNFYDYKIDRLLPDPDFANYAIGVKIMDNNIKNRILSGEMEVVDLLDIVRSNINILKDKDYNINKDINMYMDYEDPLVKCGLAVFSDEARDNLFGYTRLGMCDFVIGIQFARTNQVFGDNLQKMKCICNGTIEEYNEMIDEFGEYDYYDNHLYIKDCFIISYEKFYEIISDENIRICVHRAIPDTYKGPATIGEKIFVDRTLSDDGHAVCVNYNKR